MPIKPSSIKVVLSQQLQIVFIRTFLFFAIVFAFKANAACQKEDVSFYLEKGFNHEQVIQLCANTQTKPQDTNAPVVQQQPTPAPTPTAAPMTTAPISSTVTQNNQTGFGLYGHPDAIFLATAIEGYDVEVTDREIIFARKECFKYGVEDLNGFRNQACPNVRYSIARGGLRIVDRDNGIFGFGSTALYISGNITVEILDLNTFRAENQSEIQSIVEAKTDKLKINVRSGMPQSKVEAILLKLAG